ncbi:MAG TPA: hypothetical protein VGH34_06885 [Vicinamibacterales bacterium]
MNMKMAALVLVFALASVESVSLNVRAQSTARATAARIGQTTQDERATYDLLAPETSSFRTDYEVSVTTSGATIFFDKIGTGLTTVPSAAGDGVTDLMAGAPLKVDEVSGAQAKAGGLVDADAGSRYLRIQLARPIPDHGGQARLRVIHTYRGSESYRFQGDAIVFSRNIGLPRATFVLPAGYQLTECNVPSQVLSDASGRVRVSFMHQGPGPVALLLKARAGVPTGAAAVPRPLTNARSWEPPAAQGPTERSRLSDRSSQDRDIVYFLQQPDTNAFSLYHDYTESREGIDKYLNVVRTGSKVSNPSGLILDTGETLKAQIVTGAQAQATGIDLGGERVAPDQEVVVTPFPGVKKGQSIRLRLSETYTAPESYRLEGEEFAFERSLGRPRNSVVLPRGWYLTWLSIPGVVSQTADGLTRVDFVNGRPDSIDVLMKGKRLAAATVR